MKYFKFDSAVFSAVRMLFRNGTTLPLLVTVYAALLVALYLFVSTREATVPQLIVTFVAMVGAPLLFFLLQAACVNYTTDSATTGLLKKALNDSLKFIAVSLPVIAVTLLVIYGLAKLQARLPFETGQPGWRNSVTILMVVRYLLIGVIAPLVMIQLWIATSARGLRSLAGNLREVLGRAFAPHSLLVFSRGFLVFAVIPYLLLAVAIPTQRPWLEFSLFTVKVVLSALLILLGWVTTVGTLSLLGRQSVKSVAQE